MVDNPKIYDRVLIIDEEVKFFDRTGWIEKILTPKIVIIKIDDCNCRIQLTLEQIKKYEEAGR